MVIARGRLTAHDIRILVSVQETDTKCEYIESLARLYVAFTDAMHAHSVDPEPNAPSIDRIQKLRNQQEVRMEVSQIVHISIINCTAVCIQRHALATLLARQVTGLLQRTKLQCTVICFAAHAKNSRRFLLDLIDYIEPTMVIVGSRGRGRLKGCVSRAITLCVGGV